MEYVHQLKISENLESPPQLSSTFWTRWQHRYKTRKQLLALLINDPERVNNDLGLSTEAAMVEINKTFWQR